MAEKKRDPHIAALEAVYGALKALDDAGRKRVLSSVFALLELEGLGTPPALLAEHVLDAARDRSAPTSSRPLSLIELIQEKKPGTNAQRIALFAYYRERHQTLPRFQRDDLKSYFATAREAPAANYDRDFVEAVRKGWIHEDGADSYLTSKGVEAVEAGFEGERRYVKGKKGGKRSKGVRGSARGKTKKRLNRK